MSKFSKYLFFLCLLLFTVRLNSVNTFIDNIEISGNEYFSKEQLKKNLYIKEGRFFNRYLFEKDRGNIRYLYEINGFLNLEFEKYEYIISGSDVNIEIILNENERLKIDSLSIIGFPNKKDLTQILESNDVSQGKPFSKVISQVLYSDINQYFSNTGYPYSKIDRTEIIDTTANSADIEWRINPGKRAYFGTLKFIKKDSLDRTLNKKLLRDQIEFSTGDKFSNELVGLMQRKIYRMGIFREVSTKLYGLERESDSIDIEVSLKYDKNKWFRFFIGYGSEPELNIDTGWGNDNFLNTARKIYFEEKLSFSPDYFKSETWLGYSNPFLLGKSINFETRLFYEYTEFYKKYYQNQIGIILDASKEFTKYIKGSVGTQYYYTDVNLLDEEYIIDSLASVSSDSLENVLVLSGNSKTNLLYINAQYDNRDNVFNPKKGYNVSLSFESTVNFLVGDRYENYFKISSVFNTYTPVIEKKLVFANSIKLAYINSITDSVMINRDNLLTLGKESVFRTGKQNDLFKDHGLKLFLMGNELRYFLNDIFSFTGFLNFGQTWWKVNNKEILKQKVEYGGGIRFHFKILILRADYAYRYMKEENDKPKLVISIGQSF